VDTVHCCARHTQHSCRRSDLLLDSSARTIRQQANLDSVGLSDDEQILFMRAARQTTPRADSRGQVRRGVSPFPASTEIGASSLRISFGPAVQQEQQQEEEYADSPVAAAAAGMARCRPHGTLYYNPANAILDDYDYEARHGADADVVGTTARMDISARFADLLSGEDDEVQGRLSLSPRPQPLDQQGSSHHRDSSATPCSPAPLGSTSRSEHYRHHHHHPHPHHHPHHHHGEGDEGGHEEELLESTTQRAVRLMEEQLAAESERIRERRRRMRSSSSSSSSSSSRRRSQLTTREMTSMCRQHAHTHHLPQLILIDVPAVGIRRSESTRLIWPI
jgi:Spy/CpxP family protein refolding chaperone